MLSSTSVNETRLGPAVHRIQGGVYPSCGISRPSGFTQPASSLGSCAHVYVQLIQPTNNELINYIVLYNGKRADPRRNEIRPQQRRPHPDRDTHFAVPSEEEEEEETVAVAAAR